MNCIYKQVRLLGCFKNVAKSQCAKLHVTYTMGFLTRYMDSCLNSFDNERGQKVGPERLCAEWILKCSGRFRWTGSEHWLTDYNSLPGEETTKHLKVQDVDLSESVAMAEGIKHFFAVTELRSLKLDSCKYINDEALQYLTLVNSPLRHLQISNNKNISDNGLLSLAKCGFLQELHLKNLPRIVNRQGVYNQLQAALPNCDILYPDLET